MSSQQPCRLHHQVAVPPRSHSPPGSSTSLDCPSIEATPITCHNRSIRSRVGSTAEYANAKDLFNSMGRSISKTHKTLIRTRLIHIIYVISLVLYTVLGGYLFQVLDGQHDENAIRNYENRCSDVQNRLLQQFKDSLQAQEQLADNFTISNAEITNNFKSVLRDSLTELGDCFREWHSTNTPPTLSNADLMNSLIYAFSVFTTIGYGNVACETDYCRYATVAYAMFGIPLFFAFVSDMSLLLSTWFIRVGSLPRIKRYCCDFNFISCCLPKPKTDDRKNGGGAHVNEINSAPFQSPQSPKALAIVDTDSAILADSSPTYTGCDSDRKLASRISWMLQDDLEHNHHETQMNRLNPVSVTPVRSGRSGNRHHEPVVNSEQRRVFVAACLVFVVYMVIVSAILCPMEQWDIFTSFYFLFSSVALVGFGDVFPSDPSVVMINCAFIVFGIVLFGMCYFILQEEIREKADRASRHARKSLKKYKDNVVRSHRKWTNNNSHHRSAGKSIIPTPMSADEGKGEKHSSMMRRNSAPPSTIPTSCPRSLHAIDLDSNDDPCDRRIFGPQRSFTRPACSCDRDRTATVD